ncbi:HAD family hydrolase, partial [Pantanalinema rosaneae CENA516]|uniref:HAD family hydrolase n=1 Tax=Pantanalinema rosaneae TaxID=1620701 RepID=UPI003D6F4857
DVYKRQIPHSPFPTSLSMTDPLPSWNDGVAKQAILDFVAKVTTPNCSSFVPPSDRIAVFDNDGTLWVEQPLYVQAFFVFDRVQQLAPQHPEWQTQEPFASVLKGDLKSAMAGGESALLQLVMATHTGMTTDEFAAIAKDWLATAQHPSLKRRYTELVYQPMVELLAYLRTHDFKTFIVSGGGVEFMRACAELIYGVPPEQVIGSSNKTQYEIRDGEPVILRLPELYFFNDKAGKPAAIQHYIGKRPIAAFGNSDGDLQMLQWTTARQGNSLGMIVRHTDGDHEFAYDQSPMSSLKEALIEADKEGWIVVDMQRDWRRIFAFQ